MQKQPIHFSGSLVLSHCTIYSLWLGYICVVNMFWQHRIFAVMSRSNLGDNHPISFYVMALIVVLHLSFVIDVLFIPIFRFVFPGNRLGSLLKTDCMTASRAIKHADLFCLFHSVLLFCWLPSCAGVTMWLSCKFNGMTCVVSTFVLNTNDWINVITLKGLGRLCRRISQAPEIQNNVAAMAIDV